MSSDNWLTDVQKDLCWRQNLRSIYKATWEPIKLKPKDEQMTYFNNPRKFTKQNQYDLYFAFSRPYPLYDQRKSTENRKFLQDIRNNIFEQESKKAVPVLTSLNYGKRKAFDATENAFNRACQISSFYRRNGGVYPIVEKPVSTNTHSLTFD